MLPGTSQAQTTSPTIQALDPVLHLAGTNVRSLSHAGVRTATAVECLANSFRHAAVAVGKKVRYCPADYCFFLSLLSLVRQRLSELRACCCYLSTRSTSRNEKCNARLGSTVRFSDGGVLFPRSRMRSRCLWICHQRSTQFSSFSHKEAPPSRRRKGEAEP